MSKTVAIPSAVLLAVAAGLSTYGIAQAVEAPPDTGAISASVPLASAADSAPSTSTTTSPVSASSTSTAIASPAPSASTTSTTAPPAAASLPVTSVPSTIPAPSPGDHPLDVSLTVPATCSAGPRIYRASATSQPVRGHQVTFAVDIVGYSTPGAYTGGFTASITNPDGTTYVVPKVVGLPVTVTSTGGYIAYQATSELGRPISVKLSWTC